VQLGGGGGPSVSLRLPPLRSGEDLLSYSPLNVQGSRMIMCHSVRVARVPAPTSPTSARAATARRTVNFLNFPSVEIL